MLFFKRELYQLSNSRFPDGKMLLLVVYHYVRHHCQFYSIAVIGRRVVIN